MKVLALSIALAAGALSWSIPSAEARNRIQILPVMVAPPTQEMTLSGAMQYSDGTGTLFMDPTSYPGPMDYPQPALFPRPTYYPEPGFSPMAASYPGRDFRLPPINYPPPAFRSIQPNIPGHPFSPLDEYYPQPVVEPDVPQLGF